MLAAYQLSSEAIERAAEAVIQQQGERALSEACPSQKLNLGADHADLVPSHGRGRADSMAG